MARLIKTGMKGAQAFESFINDLIPMIRLSILVDMITARVCVQNYRMYVFQRINLHTNLIWARTLQGGRTPRWLDIMFILIRESMLAGGLYMPPTETLKRIRERFLSA
jgi:hypothetical protein